MTKISDFDRFLFVVGAPRSGTTTLSTLLARHPSIQAPLVKEPHFFAQCDLRQARDFELRERVESDFLDRFYPGVEPGRRVGLDASVSYLYLAEQLAPALRLWPRSRFVVSVRDPVSMLSSLHERLIYTGDEDLVDFEEAWRAVPERRAGRRIPRSCVDPRLLFYDEAARFATNLERLYAAVGKDNCHVVVFDDLKSNPDRELGKIFDFIGLARIDVPPLRVRPGRRVRSPRLQRLLKRPPGFSRALLGGKSLQLTSATTQRPSKSPNGPRFGALRSVRRRLLEWNRIEQPARPLPDAIRRQICQTFEGEVERLESLLDRDLSYWLQPRDGSSRLESP